MKYEIKLINAHNTMAITLKGHTERGLNEFGGEWIRAITEGGHLETKVSEDTIRIIPAAFIRQHLIEITVSPE